MHHERWESPAEARAAIHECIEAFYKRQRIHSYLGNLTPAEFDEAAAWSRWTSEIASLLPLAFPTSLGRCPRIAVLRPSCRVSTETREGRGHLSGYELVTIYLMDGMRVIR